MNAIWNDNETMKNKSMVVNLFNVKNFVEFNEILV